MKKKVFYIFLFILLLNISYYVVSFDVHNYKEKEMTMDNLALVIDEKETTIAPTTTVTTTTTTSTTTKVTSRPTTTTVSSLNSYSSVIQYENGASLNVVKSLEKYYLNVPENVRKNFERHHWKIIVVSGNLNKRFKYSKPIMGIIVYDDKTIYIDNRVSATSAIRHEMGHYISYYNLWPDDSDEFGDIFIEERNEFVRYTHAIAANTNQTIEYFAEAFEQYVINPTALKNHCPKTYNFIERYSNVL